MQVRQTRNETKEIKTKKSKNNNIALAFAEVRAASLSVDLKLIKWLEIFIYL